ncbi:MAG: FMN-binding negative transcriptional regulator [Planctomycetota bacterium]
MTLYARPKFTLDGDPLDVAAKLFTDYPFATLVATADPYHAVHTPVLVDRTNTGLTLHAHVARANTWWQRVEAHPGVLAIAQGPHAPISASWYAEPSAGTWNYVASHATCVATTVHDEAALRPFLERLTQTFDDDPEFRVEEEVMSTLVRAIVGVRLEVTEARSVVKMSQNKDDATYANIVAALEQRNTGDDASVAGLMVGIRTADPTKN